MTTHLAVGEQTVCDGEGAVTHDIGSADCRPCLDLAVARLIITPRQWSAHPATRNERQLQ